MSVAFRRESDEEHLEPKFELPIPPGPNWVTPRGLEQLHERLAQATAAVAAERDEEARKRLSRDLRYWQTRVATAEPAPAPDEGEAGVGSRVTFRLNGTERSIAIVGGDEADPQSGLLTFSAPLARALMGAAEGDLVAYNGVDDAIEVLGVSPRE